MEASHVYATNYNIKNELDQCSSSCHQDSLQSLRTGEISSFSSLLFQNSQNIFEISNSPRPVSTSNVTNTSSVPHNFSISNPFNMEEDCEDKQVPMGTSSTLINIEKLFTVFTNRIADQIVTQTNTLRDEIRENESRMVQENEIFKTAMRNELNDLQALLHVHQSPSPSSMLPTSSSSAFPVQTTSVPQAGSIPSLSPQPGLTPQSSTMGSSVSQATDIHSQMMFMMAESFSKLSTVLAETKSDTKADWPKFSGDSKKFRDWYLSIMTQVSLPPWNALYDPSTNDVVAITANTALNGKLYSKIILSLEGKALKHAVSRKHLCANGLLLLSELTKTYKPTYVPKVIAAKTVEFWGHTKCLSHESIDQYYDRFHELLDDLHDAAEPISTRSAIHQFIFTLGPEFESIQNNFRAKVLPSEWHQEDWPTILALCRDYYNSVKPQHMSRHEVNTTIPGDRSAHQEKIKDWWLNPTKYCKLIEAEQEKHQGKCLYHLTKSHQTPNCAVKRECDRLLASKQSSGSPTSASSAGQLRHITEESCDEHVDDTSDVIEEEGH